MRQMQPKGGSHTRYPRLRAPVYFTEVGLPLLRRTRQPSDAGLGGICIYTDDAPKPGKLLQIEIFLPDSTSVICKVEVAWLDEMPERAPARFDVGLRVVAIHPHDRERLTGVLRQP